MTKLKTMKTKIYKSLLALIIISSITGCMKERTDWIVQSKPITQQERDAVSAEETKILQNVPNKLELQGHDQEWYRIVESAHNSAIESCCQPRLFEYKVPAGFLVDWSEGNYTENYKQYNQSK